MKEKGWHVIIGYAIPIGGFAVLMILGIPEPREMEHSHVGVVWRITQLESKII